MCLLQPLNVLLALRAPELSPALKLCPPQHQIHSTFLWLQAARKEGKAVWQQMEAPGGVMMTMAKQSSPPLASAAAPLPHPIHNQLGFSQAVWSPCFAPRLCFSVLSHSRTGFPAEDAARGAINSQSIIKSLFLSTTRAWKPRN